MVRRSLRVRVLEEYRLELDQLRSCLREERTDIEQERSHRRFALYLNKMPHHIRELFLADIEREYQTRRTSQRFGDIQKEFVLTRGKLQIKDWSLYKIFLRSRGNEESIGELHRIAVAREILPSACFIKGRGMDSVIIDDRKIVLKFGCKRDVLINGDIIYSENGQAFLHDQGDRLLVVIPEKGVPLALALADKKWGSQLTAEGSDNFRHLVANEVVSQQLQTTFIDERTNDLLALYRRSAHSSPK